MMHRNLAFESQCLQPCLVVEPQTAAPAAADWVLLEIAQTARRAVTRSIVPAAVERPIVDAELPPNEPRGLLLALGAAERNVCLACAEVADLLARVELDQYLGMKFVQLSQDGRQQRDR